ncbi:hypothetical protein M0R45_033412 [Rubus argutus]|uniref:RING-CH-type domain-containing protein n=1 Tax=Rubus argutus TaxID=59490 RepID=A0AAW1WMF0_RUBAR
MESSSTENLEVSSVAELIGEEMTNEASSSSSSSSTVLCSECRICQVEDSTDQMEAPCRCNGTLKFAHRDCIQQWINSRYKTTCEICNQPYEGGYRVTVPPPAPPRPTRREVEEARRVIAEAERVQAAAARAELYLARLNAANSNVFGANALCRIALVVVIGFYILFIAGNVGSGALHFRIEPPSRSPSAQPQAPPQFTMDNNIYSPGLGFNFDMSEPKPTTGTRSAINKCVEPSMQNTS